VGFAKTQMLEEEERGWATSEKNVCVRCVEDSFLKSVVRRSFVAKRCDYCKSNRRAAPVDHLIEIIYGTLRKYFAEPADAGVPYEGEYLIQPIDTDEALDLLGFEADPELFDDVSRAINNEYWVPAAQGHWATEHQSSLLQTAWYLFQETVRHRTRYMFERLVDVDAGASQDIDPAFMLDELANAVSARKLIKSVKKNLAIYRCRLRSEGDDWPLDAVEMGAPPYAKAGAGRMNPIGIPYFYGALDATTAAAEVLSSPPQKLVTSEWRIRKSIYVLDLTALPPTPSVFDEAAYDARQNILFLKHFVDEVTHPIAKDGREHIGYIPTQIVCEYFATAFRRDAEQPMLRGILYPSAVYPGGKNLVVFPDFEREGERFKILEMIEATLQKITSWTDVADLLKRTEG